MDEGREPNRRSSRLLLWSLCAVLATGAMAAPPMTVDRPREAPAEDPSDDDPRLVKLGTRAFVPRGRADAVGLRDDKVFLQFERTLTAEEQDALERAGVVFHESFEPFTYLVEMSVEAGDVVQRHPSFLGAEPI